MSKKKVFFVTANNSTFVRQDLDILNRSYRVTSAFFPKADRKNLFYTFCTFIRIFIGVLKADVSYAVFADLRAYFVVLCSKLLGRRSIVMVGGYESAAIPEINYGGLLKRGQAKRFRYILDYANHIITVSQFSNLEVQSFHSLKEYSVINLGVEETKAANIFSKEDLIITVGSSTVQTSKIKGLVHFALASLEFPKLRFQIIGNYDEVVKTDLLAINPALEFPGFLSTKDLHQTFSKAKIYCQLSLRESFGLAVLEAMSFGCIPVVTSAGALPEVVDDTGFYTEYGNVSQTVISLKKALKNGDPEKVYRRAKEKYKIEFREKKIKAIIENL